MIMDSDCLTIRIPLAKRKMTRRATNERVMSDESMDVEVLSSLLEGTKNARNP